MNIEKIDLPDSLYIEVTPASVAALQLYTEALEDSDPSDLDTLERTLEKFDDAHAYIATDEDGTVCAVANYREEFPRAWVSGVAVAEQARGQGVGLFMMKQLSHIAFTNGCNSLELKSVPSAIGFYEKLGFVAIEYHDHMPLMHLDLSRQ